MLIKDIFFKTIADAYPSVRSVQTDDGRIVYPVGGYTINHQYAGFYYAFLHAYDHPDNPYKGDADMVRLSLLCWKHYGSMINDQGKVHFISMDQEYGYWPEEWGFYFWLSSYELLKDALCEKDQREWLDMLSRIYRMFVAYTIEKDASEQFAQELAVHQVNNHFVWVALALYRYGQILEVQEALDLGARMMKRILDAQLPIGAWLENQSFVLDYANTTTRAISLYELYSGDLQAKQAVRRSLDFILSFKNPDFTKVIGIDERNHYNKKIPFTAPSFALYEDGRAYLSRSLSKHEPDRYKNNVYELAMSCEVLRMLPEAAEFMSDPKTPPPLDTRYPEHLTAVREMGPWILSFCGLQHTSFDSHWSLERQGLFGIYLKDSGPLCGGAHSIADPAFSLFNVISFGKMHYMHDSCKLSDRSVALRYGDHTCTAEVLRVDDHEVAVRFRVEDLTDTEKAYVNMPLHELRGTEVEIDELRIMIGEDYHWLPVAQEAAIRVHGTEIVFSEESTFRYPFFPHNPYLQKQVKDYSHVFGMLSVELDYLKPAVIMTLKR